jgi:predicted aspartyl protease
MGHVREPLRITNAEDARRTRLVDDVLVDTGAISTVVRAELAEALGLRIQGSARVRTAEGEQELRASWAELEIEGKQLVTHVLVSDTPDEPVIGVTTLEGMGSGPQR